jgi:hypothetical protein
MRSAARSEPPAIFISDACRRARCWNCWYDANESIEDEEEDEEEDEGDDAEGEEAELPKIELRAQVSAAAVILSLDSIKPAPESTTRIAMSP